MKLVIGIVITAVTVGFLAGSILGYPAGAGNAITNPWDAMQLTVYKIVGQEEKVAEIEDRIENEEKSPKELEELASEENSPPQA